MRKPEAKILIIEDDYRLASEWQIELKEKGYYVNITQSASEAVTYLRHNYNYFIVDLFHIENRKVYPDGGINSIAKIRAYTKQKSISAIIIVITGLYQEGGVGVVSTESVVKNLGADYAFPKPLDIQQIIDLIEEHQAE